MQRTVPKLSIMIIYNGICQFYSNWLPLWLSGDTWPGKYKESVPSVGDKPRTKNSTEREGDLRFAELCTAQK